MNYGLIYHNNKQTKSPMLRFQKSKQKKISDTNKTNAAVFCGVTGKNFLNTFRKSSKDKSNLKYKTSKNSPNSSHKKIEVVEEYKKFSNEHKDTQPGGKDGNSKKRKNINKNDLYDDLFLKKVKKIYPKGVEHNYNAKLKKSGSNLFNMHSNNLKDQNNITHKKDNKKHLYSNNISNMDYTSKINHHHNIDNSSEENNIIFNNNNNKNHSIIGTSLNPIGIMVNSSSILPTGNNTNLNLNDIGNNQNNGVNINNNIINNISNLININGNETGFVSNYNLMKHIENKYEKKGGINNYVENSKERPIMEKAYSNLNIKSGNHSKQNSKGKISNINSFNIGNNKFVYPKYMVKYGEENYSNLNVNNISKKSNGSLPNGERIGIGAYSEFTKLNKTAYPSKTNSSKNSLDKRKSKLLGNNNHNNIFINNDSLLQNPEDNNINEIIINTNRDKSSDNNINIIDNLNNEIPIQDQSKSSKEPVNNNININNNSNSNTFYSSNNNLMKSSKLSNNNSNHNSNTNINNNINKNVNVIINNSNKNISIINVNNISYNKQKKIEINNSGICNTNRVKNNNYLIKKISGMQARPYVEYISTADKNRNTTNMTNADKRSKKNTEKNLDNNVIKILHYKKTPLTKTKSCYGRHELHNRSNSGLLTSNQLEMLVSDIILKKKITRISKDFNTSLNSKNSKSKSKSKKNIEDSFHKGNNTSRPETNKNRLIKNSVPISSCQSPGMKLNNILLESNNNTGNNNKEKVMPSEISERQSLNNINNLNNVLESANNTNINNNSSKNLNLNINDENNIENQKMKLYNEINEKITSKENSLDNNHKNKSSNTSRCLNYKEIEFNKLSSNLNKQKSYINNNNLSLLEKKIIKNLKEDIKLGLITNNTKNLINKKEQIRDNNSTGLKKHLKSQKLIKDLHVFNPKFIKYHLLNAGKVMDKSSNQSKRESKDKIKKHIAENKVSVTPPKTDKYTKKIYNNNINNVANILSSNKKNEKEEDKEIDHKEYQNDININNQLYEDLKPQKLLKLDNYNDYKEMLCEPSSSIKIKEDNVHLTTTASHDCNFYKNEMEKLSAFIKDYYLENGCYPKTDNQFYLFGRQIGHGAFGKVNISLHVASGRLVAIKTFKKKNLKNKHARNKIKHEIDMLGKLRHPFITQILDSFETDKHIFIVMEYICGDLLGFIRKRGKLSEPMTKVIFKQIIEGLRYIHKKKIVHRDIKLDNILIDLTNTVKICDFGVSKKINKGDIMYDHCGTPAYIAPEIFKNRGYEGFSCDIWSAGVTLYYMLGGVQPFCADSMKDLEKIILEGKYDKLEGVSDEANDLIDKMLQLDPKKRLTDDEILNHPWIANINLNHRSKLSLFTDAEKILLSKFNVDYLTSDKSELIENFTLKNLETNKDSKDEGNTKSVIFAPYNSYIESNDEENKENEDFLKIKKKKKREPFEEEIIYKELKVRNDICKFGYRVHQANIQYELSNNKDFENGFIKTQKEEEFKNENEKIERIDEEKILSARLSGLNSPKVRSANDSFEDSEKITIKKELLKSIEKNIGYDRKYIINCLQNNKINYATATYYLMSKDEQYNSK